MKLCHICGQNKPNFYFPSDVGEAQSWCTIFGCQLPTKIGLRGSKLCQDHFDEGDIYTNSRGAKKLKKGSKPLKLYDETEDHTVYLVSREHIKIGANKALVASSFKYLKNIMSSSFYQTVDSTIYFPDTNHFVIKCYPEVLYSYGEVMKIDLKYKAKMAEFLKLIGCDVLVVDEEGETNEVKEEEEDNNNAEEHQGDNNDANVSNILAFVETGQIRKKLKKSNRDDSMSTPGHKIVIKTYNTTFKQRNQYDNNHLN